MKKYLARSFFFLLYQFISTTLPQRRNRFHRASHGGQRGHRGRIFPQGRIGRHVHLVGLRQGAGDNRRALPSVAVEPLRVPLLRRRQLRLRQSRRAEGRRGAGRDLQPVRLRRDQTAGLALLRILDAQRVPPNPGAELSDRADRAQGRHLAVVQGVPGQGPGEGSMSATPHSERVAAHRDVGPAAISSNGTRAFAPRPRSSGSTAIRRSSSSAITPGCSATWRTPACRRTTRIGRTASRTRS